MSEFTFHQDGTSPKGGEIFVFGSNLAGRHGAGAAKAARMHFGAITGQGRGRQGQSYAIPTKDGRPGTPSLSDPRATLSLEEIALEAQIFLDHARDHPEERFFVTRIGCGLAGYADASMAPLFRGAPPNCSFPDEWAPFLMPTPNQTARPPAAR